MRYAALAVTGTAVTPVAYNARGQRIMAAGFEPLPKRHEFEGPYAPQAWTASAPPPAAACELSASGLSGLSPMGSDVVLQMKGYRVFETRAFQSCADIYYALTALRSRPPGCSTPNTGRHTGRPALPDSGARRRSRLQRARRDHARCAQAARTSRPELAWRVAGGDGRQQARAPARTVAASAHDDSRPSRRTNIPASGTRTQRGGDSCSERPGGLLLR